MPKSTKKIEDANSNVVITLSPPSKTIYNKNTYVPEITSRLRTELTLKTLNNVEINKIANDTPDNIKYSLYYTPKNDVYKPAAKDYEEPKTDNIAINVSDGVTYHEKVLILQKNISNDSNKKE